MVSQKRRAKHWAVLPENHLGQVSRYAGQIRNKPAGSNMIKPSVSSATAITRVGVVLLCGFCCSVVREDINLMKKNKDLKIPPLPIHSRPDMDMLICRDFVGNMFYTPWPALPGRVRLKHFLTCDSCSLGGCSNRVP